MLGRGVLGGGPGGEQLQLVFGLGARVGGVGDQGQFVAGQLQGVAGELEVAHDPVVESFAGGPVKLDVLPGREGYELVAVGRQLPDQIVGHVVPVHEEAARMRIQEQVPSQVRRQPVLVENTPVQGPAQLVRSDDLHPRGPHVRRDRGHPGQDRPDRGPRRRLGLTARRTRSGGGGVVGEVEQMLPFGVELQGACHGLKHRLRRARKVAAPEPGVIVDA